MSNKTKTTVRLPKEVRDEMLQAIVADGYGLRGKSRWVVEAIENLLLLPNYHELVDIGVEIEGLTEVEAFYLPSKIKYALDDALLNIRKHYPTMEGVKSSIVRTGIMQRLLRATVEQ